MPGTPASGWNLCLEGGVGVFELNLRTLFHPSPFIGIRESVWEEGLFREVG